MIGGTDVASICLRCEAFINKEWANYLKTGADYYFDSDFAAHRSNRTLTHFVYSSLKRLFSSSETIAYSRRFYGRFGSFSAPVIKTERLCVLFVSGKNRRETAFVRNMRAESRKTRLSLIVIEFIKSDDNNKIIFIQRGN